MKLFFIVSKIFVCWKLSDGTPTEDVLEDVLRRRGVSEN